jgi:hypothetical protein
MLGVIGFLASRLKRELIPGVVWAFQSPSHSGKTIRQFPRLEPALGVSRTGQ